MVGQEGVSDGPSTDVEKLQFLVRNLAFSIQVQEVLIDSLFDVLIGKGILNETDMEAIKSDLNTAVSELTSGVPKVG